MELHDIAVVLTETDENHEHKRPPRSMVDTLTGDLFRPLLDNLRLEDQARLSATCRRVRRHVLDTWSAVQHIAPSSSSTSSSSLLRSLQHMVNLRDVDMCSTACDELLRLLGTHCTRLERLNVARSPNVTHDGLRALSDGCIHLTYVDITFCASTDFGAVLILRGDPGPEAASSSFNPRPVVVRRQLQWQDGHFHCPWQPPEIHTYYPDGSFQFSREAESRGWVADLEERCGTGPHHLADRLRYTNLDLPPDVDQTYFLPGVLLQRDVGRPGEVLIVQSRTHLRPPANFPTDDDNGTLSTLPVGQSTHFGPPWDPLLVSRMAVGPLGAHEQLCPDELLMFNRAFYHAHPALQRYEGDVELNDGEVDDAILLT